MDWQAAKGIVLACCLAMGRGHRWLQRGQQGRGPGVFLFLLGGVAGAGGALLAPLPGQRPPVSVALLAGATPSAAPSVVTEITEERAPPPEPPSAKRETPLAPDAAAAYLAEAWRVVTGADPSPKTLAVLWAQWALETGRGTAMVDNNFAGLKGRSPGGESAVRWTWERSAGGVERLRRRFRAYGSPAEGAQDYVVVLRDRFGEAFAAAREGDAGSFARALARAGYHTADATEYERALRLLWRERLSQNQGE